MSRYINFRGERLYGGSDGDYWITISDGRVTWVSSEALEALGVPIYETVPRGVGAVVKNTSGHLYTCYRATEADSWWVDSNREPYLEREVQEAITNGGTVLSLGVEA